MKVCPECGHKHKRHFLNCACCEYTTSSLSETMGELEADSKITKDLRKASKLLGFEEARFIVDAYYAAQKKRVASGNQATALEKTGEPNEILSWIMNINGRVENVVGTMLKHFASSHITGQWSMRQHGIGPVISAGLVAHIDVTKAVTAAQCWSFAGLDPKAEWKKGEKRPWNGRLKTIMWHAGQCIKRTHNSPKSFYGRFYRERKELDQKKNEAGDLREQAERKLEKFKIGKSTEAYKWYSKGMLPPGHIDARACRYAAKMFLAHYFQVAFESHYVKPAPVPYIIAHDERHTKLIPAPGWRLDADGTGTIYDPTEDI